VLRQFLFFCIVGTVGFVVDSTALLALTQFMGMHHLLGRVFSFLLAATITWTLNLRFTFRAVRRARSWLPYVLATSFGAVINITVYQVWVLLVGTTPTQLLIGVALGSISALFFNFLISRRIFAGRPGFRAG
jgi:putative flippase GtrA